MPGLAELKAAKPGQIDIAYSDVKGGAELTYKTTDAVFHFLTDPEDRAAYLQQVMKSVKPGGHVIVATFAPDGPEQCSGLPVARYAADQLHGEFGPSFELLEHANEEHKTPSGLVQHFVYCHCLKPH